MNRGLRSPFGYFGGKTKIAGWIVRHLPPHEVYCEPFAGSAAVLFAKSRSRVEVIGDKDEGIVNFFRVLRDEPERLISRLEWTPFSREVFEESIRYRYDRSLPDWERAYYWYVCMKQSFGGDALRSKPTWGYTVRTSRCGMAISCRHFMASVALLPLASERLQGVSILCADWLELVLQYDSPETLFYLDPPYHPEVRRGGGYFHEMTDEDHRRLVDVVLGLSGKVVLSGYPNRDYERLERAGWRRVEYRTACRAVGHTRQTRITGRGSGWANAPRVECLWLSFDDSVASFG